ncbi:protein of unknown function DUF302 [Thioalkalivibrio nitratireducens DSM 14787]|uniref:DUF302 domain-containing protein n=1 Tax=Thioalkalivibrio nitratireducens (strain DSM 14787 / UNIQEM 213 / ALEN2) TaxID=1255043 RepID=L0E2A2_THIND|nr:DUF302 domain-containing protein [Thioalkalivibrio nitratireducens]AGA35408.1 protein of unknown function DUF302 [Thioalkalivibrio nitratireducens DSM 14787]
MKKMLVSLMLALGLMVAAQSSAMEMDKETMRQMVDYSIQKWKLDDGVTVQDAVDSMQLRANLLNFMMVADLPLSEQVEAMGEEDVPYMRILAFCDALIANEMVKYDIIFSGFLPCRIAVVEDEEGQGWITTMNMDMMLHAVDLSPELEPLAQHVRDVIYEIVEAGVSGDF